jgi:hypothetical protein
VGVGALSEIKGTLSANIPNTTFSPGFTDSMVKSISEPVVENLAVSNVTVTPV